MPQVLQAAGVEASGQFPFVQEKKKNRPLKGRKKHSNIELHGEENSYAKGQ